ncbi:hypothetical protein ACFQX6_52685 [Streptosporangium lutulentum]
MAAAYAAGAFVAGLFILPGGGKPRRAVSRVLTGAIRSPGAAMVTTIVLGTLAFLAVMTALNVDQASFTVAAADRCDQRSDGPLERGGEQGHDERARPHRRPRRRPDEQPRPRVPDLLEVSVAHRLSGGGRRLPISRR